MKNKHIDNLIERALIIMPDADYDRVCSVAPVLAKMERNSVQHKIDHIRQKLQKIKGGQ